MGCSAVVEPSPSMSKTQDSNPEHEEKGEANTE